MVLDNAFQTATGLTELQLKQELAVWLYSQKLLSGGRARSLAGMDIFEFQEFLEKKNLYVNYGVEDFEQDMETLKKLGRI